MSENVDSIERIAADILIAAISGQSPWILSTQAETNAKELAKAYRIIHQAVLDARLKPRCTDQPE